MAPFADLYIACMPEGRIGRVACAARQAQIEAAETEAGRRQRYYVWKLLELALGRSIGTAQVGFSRDENGKWTCPQCFFSLSHSENAVAVAVSDRPIGVDIEGLDRPVNAGLARKILTERELAAYEALPAGEKEAWLLRVWCAKESLFKRAGGRQFLPRKIEWEENIPAGSLELSGRRYAYAVATDEKLRIITDVAL